LPTRSAQAALRSAPAGLDPGRRSACVWPAIAPPRGQRIQADGARLLLRFVVVFRSAARLFAMIELNAVRSQIADLSERLDVLRGYL
jgi:hypothetical protein